VVFILFCAAQDSCPCILDLLINYRLHWLDRCSAVSRCSESNGLGISTPPPMAFQMVYWPWPSLFSPSSHSFVLPPCGSFLYWAVWQHPSEFHLPIYFTPKQNNWSGTCFVNHNPIFHVPIVKSISLCLFHCSKHLFWGSTWSFKTTGFGLLIVWLTPSLEVQNFILGFTVLERCCIWLLCFGLSGWGDPAVS
jgi:hypothetical protein